MDSVWRDDALMLMGTDGVTTDVMLWNFTDVNVAVLTRVRALHTIVLDMSMSNVLKSDRTSLKENKVYQEIALEYFWFLRIITWKYPCLYAQPRSKLQIILNRSSFHRLLMITLD